MDRPMLAILLLLVIAGPAAAPGPALQSGRVTFTADGMSADGANITRLYTVDTTAGYRLYFGNLTDAPYLTSTAADAISTPDTLQVDGRAKLSHTNSSVCLGNGASTYDACIFRSTANEVQASDDLAVTDDLRVGDDLSVGSAVFHQSNSADATRLSLQGAAAEKWTRVIENRGASGLSAIGPVSGDWVGHLQLRSIRNDAPGATLCVYFLRGDASTVELWDPDTECSTSSSCTQVCIYQDGTTRIKNGYSTGSIDLYYTCFCYLE